MKFIYADSIDVVDPAYDFLRDRNGEHRAPYWDDVYPHEILGFAPYDGVLISRGIVGGPAKSGKYSASQAMRLRRVGARVFLRLDRPEFADLSIFGDCGAFTYHREDQPPYSSEDMLEFYDDGGFTHGCSVDHIIFDFDESLTALEGGSEEARRRFDITLENADDFLRASRRMSASFTPLGVIQGWSPGSMAQAAQRMRDMGYSYLALGGTVPLKASQIRACLRAIRDAVPADQAKLHILGFAKADEIESFLPFGITSFDTTSPLLRAFKDAKANYYLPAPNGRGLVYYTAIRVPQAIENPKLMRLAKRGVLNQEELQRLERECLAALRAYDRGTLDLEETLERVLAYTTPATLGEDDEHLPGSRKIAELRTLYARTLQDRPWTRCSCAICQALSIEVIIFRASNRNKRRGIHNLGIYKGLVDGLPETPTRQDEPDLLGNQGPAKPNSHRVVVRRERG
jgi:hypothetical protein